MRCAIVVRVSTGRIEQASSLENQKRMFYRYVADKGWDIHDFYIDQKSGTTENREGLQRLFEDGIKGRYDIILSKELSRLARNVVLAYKIRDMVERYNLDLITLDGAINTIEKKGNMFGLYAWIYELEAQNTSERLKLMFKTKAQIGEFNGSNPPYGYQVVNKKLVIRKDQTPDVVRRIFREYISGKGFDSIARGLYNDDVTTPSQLAQKTNATTKWHGSSVRKILENPHYTGTLNQCRDHKLNVTSKTRKINPISDQIIIKNSHEPIIPIEDFLIAQELIKSRKRTRPQSEKYIFTNTAICNDCGRGMHFKKNRKGYICGNYNKHGAKACNSHYISQDELLIIVKNDLNRLYKKVNKDHYFQKLIRETTLKKVKLRETIENNIEELEAKKRDKTNLVIALSNGLISNDDYQLAINTLNEVITTIETDNSKISKELEHQDIEKDLKEFKKNLSTFAVLQSVTPQLLHTLIDRIEINTDGTANIHYRFKEPANPSA